MFSFTAVSTEMVSSTVEWTVLLSGQSKVMCISSLLIICPLFKFYSLIFLDVYSKKAIFLSIQSTWSFYPTVVLVPTDNFISWTKIPIRICNKVFNPHLLSNYFAWRQILTVDTINPFSYCYIVHFSELFSKAGHAMMPFHWDLLFLGIFFNSYLDFHRQMYLSSTLNFLASAWFPLFITFWLLKS